MKIKSQLNKNLKSFQEPYIRQKHRHKISVSIFILISIYLFAVICSFSLPSKAQNNLNIPELLLDDEINYDNSTSLLIRSKRQWGCPNGCFSSCMDSAQCQRYQLATVCVLGCCCPAATVATNLSSACDGDPAVAACLNGLCGQGYFCNSKNFCCRCQSGTSPGPCVNNLCQAGYACNTNNFCCSLGSGSVLGPCVNGQCPTGYACGAGNLCYPVTAASNPIG